MAILRSAFSQTYLPPALDIRRELSDLDTVCTRSSAAVAKQIEEYVSSTLSANGGSAGTPPDGTVAATVSLARLYPAVTAFRREVRTKLERAANV